MKKTKPKNFNDIIGKKKKKNLSNTRIELYTEDNKTILRVGVILKKIKNITVFVYNRVDEIVCHHRSGLKSLKQVFLNIIIIILQPDMCVCRLVQYSTRIFIYFLIFYITKYPVDERAREKKKTVVTLLLLFLL